jgi:hypothetical protein
MVDLTKFFDDLVAVSQGDVGRLSRATQQFTHDIIQTNQIILPWPPAVATPSEELEIGPPEAPASSSS